jgi:membrane protease YdiL (CAAX protease family)
MELGTPFSGTFFHPLTFPPMEPYFLSIGGSFMPSQETYANPQHEKNTIAHLGIYMTFFYLVWTLKSFFLNPLLDGGHLPNHPILHLILYEGIKIFVWIIPVWWIIKRYYQEDPVSFLKLQKNASRGIGWGIVTGILFLAALIVIDLLWGDRSFHWHQSLMTWIGRILLVGLVEEIPFRGFLLQDLSKRTTFLRANLIVALLFTLMHYPGWFVQHATVISFIINSFGIFIRALFFGWLMKRTDSIWAPVIFHMANNFGHMIILP